MKKYIAGIILCMLTGIASAQKAGDVYIQVGIADINISNQFSIHAAGVPLDGADAHLSGSATLGIVLGRYFTDNISAIIIGGWPPTTEAKGGGILEGFTLGEVTYAPIIGLVNYHFSTSGKLKPFIGAGIAYNQAIKTKDNALTNLKMNSSANAVLRAGLDYSLNQKWGAFISVNKLFLDHEFSGNVAVLGGLLGGVPITANAELDILMVHAGLSYQF